MIKKLLILGLLYFMYSPIQAFEGQQWMIFDRGENGEMAEQLWIGPKPNETQVKPGAVVLEFTLEMQQAEMAAYQSDKTDYRHYQLQNGEAVLVKPLTAIEKQIQTIIKLPLNQRKQYINNLGILMSGEEIQQILDELQKQGIQVE